VCEVVFGSTAAYIMCALSNDTASAKSAQYQQARRAAVCIKPSQLYECIAVPIGVIAPVRPMQCLKTLLSVDRH